MSPDHSRFRFRNLKLGRTFRLAPMPHQGDTALPGFDVDAVSSPVVEDRPNCEVASFVAPFSTLAHFSAGLWFSVLRILTFAIADLKFLFGVQYLNLCLACFDVSHLAILYVTKLVDDFVMKTHVRNAQPISAHI